MTFLAIMVVFFIVQYWGSGQPVHKDEWWGLWSERVRQSVSNSEIIVLGQVVVPVIGVFLVFGLLSSVSQLLVFSASIFVLLYSLGRGDFTELVKAYIEAYHRQDNETAAEYAQRLGVDTDELLGWDELNKEVLRQSVYHGLERMFAAFFWFFVLGPLGALLYRLANFSANSDENTNDVRLFAMRLVWLLEWPVVRILGCTFALTGHFVGCFQRVVDALLNTGRSTLDELEIMVHGALNVNAQESITEQEVEALLPLLSRTLIFWLCVMGVLSLL
jgi:AmpE protein